MSAEVQITGLVETQRMLMNLSSDLVEAGFQSALIAGSSVVQGALIDHAPRRQGEEPTKREFPILSESTVTDIDVKISAGRGVASTGFGEAGPVALWNEMGHEIVTHTRRDTGQATEPHPFMAETTEACAEEAIDDFCDALMKTVGSRYAR